MIRSRDTLMALEGKALIDGIVRGDSRAIARAISTVERGGPEGLALSSQLFPLGGHALVVGVTGAAGTGKSTLVDRLITTLRAGGSTVGVIAVDPSSPFSGGAVLGDRVRMGGHAADAGVFIRSMATRGHLGGLATATAEAVAVLDAAGRDVVIVETVGVGQDEVDVFRLAAVTVLVLVPGTGDDVQAIKAGVMEIADVFVVNKADRPEADRMVDAVNASLALASPPEGAWHPPVLMTQATTGEGVDALWDAISACHAHRTARGDDRAQMRAADRLRLAIARQAAERVATTTSDEEWARVLADLAGRRLSPEQAAEQLLVKAFIKES
jgi:LAO/AO transport system kinase